MASPTKFLRLPLTDRALFVKTAVLLVAVRVGLTLLPFRVVQRLLAPLVKPRQGAKAETRSPRSITWAVPVAARFVPRASCLTQALTGQVLLARQGHPSRLQIGVARDEGGKFAAHAWLLCDGQIVLGGQGHESFTPLVAWGGESV